MATNFNKGMNSALQEKNWVLKSDEIKLKFGLHSRLWTFIVINKIWILSVLFKSAMLPSWQDYYKDSHNCITILGNSDDMKDNKRFFKLLPRSSEILSVCTEDMTELLPGNQHFNQSRSQ